MIQQDCSVASVAIWIMKNIQLERGHTARIKDTTLVIEADGNIAPETRARYQGQIEFALRLVSSGDALPSLSQEELWALIG